jgi:hypothetical protein
MKELVCKVSIFQKMKNWLANHCETQENHQDEQLRSRYYKTTAANALKTVKEIVEKSPELELLSVSEERGELSVAISKGKKAFMVITIISVRPFETAVDFSVTTETKFLPFDFGFSRAVILEMYKKLDQHLNYIGSGINADM